MCCFLGISGLRSCKEFKPRSGKDKKEKKKENFHCIQVLVENRKQAQFHRFLCVCVFFVLFFFPRFYLDIIVLGLHRPMWVCEHAFLSKASWQGVPQISKLFVLEINDGKVALKGNFSFPFTINQYMRIYSIYIYIYSNFVAHSCIEGWLFYIQIFYGNITTPS